VREFLLVNDVAKLKTQLAEAERQRDNLLARIHRDGGHYTERHGVERSCHDADLRVAEAYGRIDELLAAATDAVDVADERGQWCVTSVRDRTAGKLNASRLILSARPVAPKEGT
jgi:hypothetical protein